VEDNVANTGVRIKEYFLAGQGRANYIFQIIRSPLLLAQAPNKLSQQSSHSTKKRKRRSSMITVDSVYMACTLFERTNTTDVPWSKTSSVVCTSDMTRNRFKSK